MENPEEVGHDAIMRHYADGNAGGLAIFVL